MNIETARDFLLWCSILNYALLLGWFLFFRFAHHWMHEFHGRWFRLSTELFDAIHYAGMAIYKIGIILFNLIPLISLYIVG